VKKLGIKSSLVLPPVVTAPELPSEGWTVVLAGKFVAYFALENVAIAFASANKGATVEHVTVG
jgi:hypothetical protein